MVQWAYSSYISLLQRQGSADRIPVFIFLLFVSFPNQSRRGARYEKKRKCTKVARNEESWRARERREKKKKDRQALQERVELRDPGDSCVSRVPQLEQR